MKTYNNLYQKLCSLENLRLAFKKARKGKSTKWYVKEFEANLENGLLKLKSELEYQTIKLQHDKKIKKLKKLLESYET